MIDLVLFLPPGKHMSTDQTDTQSSTELELIKLLLEEVRNNQAKNNSPDIGTIMLIVLIGLILFQKLIRYSHRIYKHFSATPSPIPTTHNSESY